MDHTDVDSNGKFRWESDRNETFARAAFLQVLQGQCVITGYHLNKLPHAVYNYGITKLALMGSVCSIHVLANCLNIVILKCW